MDDPILRTKNSKFNPFKSSMLPFKSVTVIFNTLVGDLTNTCGKSCGWYNPNDETNGI